MDANSLCARSGMLSSRLLRRAHALRLRDTLSSTPRSPRVATRLTWDCRCAHASTPRASEASQTPPTLSIATPVTGHRHMLRALRSVQQQDVAVGCLQHLVFVDGPRPGVAQQIRSLELRHPVHVVELPYAVGTDGWLGHRMYGAACFLNSSDYLMYFDEDNVLDADHASSVLCAMEAAGLPSWGHSLRKIYDPSSGEFVCIDAVDSLGTLGPTRHDPPRRFVDTNCMVVRRDVAPLVASGWYNRRKGADSAVSADLCARFSDGICTNRFTVSYVAASSSDSNGLAHFTQPEPLAAVIALAEAGPPLNTAPLDDC